MKKNILHIISSPRGKHSDSTLLGNKIIEKLLEQYPYPGSEVIVNNVQEKNYQPLTEIHIEAFRLSRDAQSSAHKEAISDSDNAVAEMMNAEIIVISVPTYNFSISAALKGWIDHIIRAGKTFSYATGIPEGLLTNRKVYLAIASTGVYSEGPMKPMDHAEPYLRFILGFIGLTDITTYRIEGTGIPGILETAVEKGLASVKLLAPQEVGR